MSTFVMYRTPVVRELDYTDREQATSRLLNRKRAISDTFFPAISDSIIKVIKNA